MIKKPHSRVAFLILPYLTLYIIYDRIVLLNIIGGKYVRYEYD